jgi:dolichyl-phosphate beta-glucosyltransferase
MSSFAIIIPCYNEADRIQARAFVAAANANPEMELYFINDGSTDATEKKLLEIQKGAPQIKIISLEKNSGKGEAIRKGLLAAIQEQHQLIGYLDADLSTSMEEFLRLKNLLISKELDLVLGSRIKKMDTVIERSFFRHIAGRMIATIIDQKFKLGVYDTQCGAKIFRSALIQSSIQERFYTKWFFDAELLVRIKKYHSAYAGAEIPLGKWQNVANSKLSVLSFPIVMKDLFVLLNKY